MISERIVSIGALHSVGRSQQGAPVVHRSVSELVPRTWRPRKMRPPRSGRPTFMTAQPIERAPGLRRERRRTRPADAAHGPTFASLGVPVPLAVALAAAGFAAPSPTRAAVLPDALAGADILGGGRPGWGKTWGFCFPRAAGRAGGHPSAGRPRRPDRGGRYPR